jgi:hypothetical protein
MERFESDMACYAMLQLFLTSSHFKYFVSLQILVIYDRSPLACFLVLWFRSNKAVLLSSGELLFPLVVRTPYPPLWRFCSQVLRRADDQLETKASEDHKDTICNFTGRVASAKMCRISLALNRKPTAIAPA